MKVEVIRESRPLPPIKEVILRMHPEEAEALRTALWGYPRFAVWTAALREAVSE